MDELGSGSPIIDPADLIDADDRDNSLVMGGVIGASALLPCGILHCYFTSDQRRYDTINLWLIGH
jgi:hypothetical protein